MPAYVALLRGINVGGKHSLPMAKVREVCERIGGKQVATYIQSGNVVLRHAQRSPTQLALVLSTALTETAGFTVPVVARTAEQWAAAIAATPFVNPDVLHCAFLPQRKTTGAEYEKVNAIDRDVHRPSEFALVGWQVYLHLPDGIGRAKLATTVLRAFPDATTRNWRTVLTLQEMIAPL